jgi:hypothetical protein
MAADNHTQRPWLMQQDADERFAAQRLWAYLEKRPTIMGDVYRGNKY